MRCWCGVEMLPWRLDSRFVFCKRCNVEKCGFCGGVLTMKIRKSRYQDIAEGIIPKKILEFLIKLSRPFLCGQCGRKFPYKSDFIRYIFWELRVFSWKLCRH